VSALAWFALGGPVAAAGVGWLVGWFMGRQRDATEIAELKAMAETRRIELAHLRHQVAALSAADMSDDAFDELLDEVASS